MKKRSLFEPRKNAKPYEYPELIYYKDAIRHSYWLHTEFNFTSDIQDYKAKVTPYEKNVITKTMLAISQIEVVVKRFWSDLYNFLPKPEIDMVGVTFGESEARHFDSYSFLLELLGMNEMFERIDEFEALSKRYDYMVEFTKRKTEDKQGLTMALILFSLFIEHISLFGQFYTMMSFNRFENKFKGISNAVEATSKEEEIHGKFGIELYRILRVEHSELFTDEFFKELVELAEKGYQAEMGIIEWIYEDEEGLNQDLPFCRKNVLKAFVTNRYNNSLAELGLDLQFPVDQGLLKETKWFDLELVGTKETDFFNKRSTDYSKKTKAITSDDLF